MTNRKKTRENKEGKKEVKGKGKEEKEEGREGREEVQGRGRKGGEKGERSREKGRKRRRKEEGKRSREKAKEREKGGEKGRREKGERRRERKSTNIKIKERIRQKNRIKGAKIRRKVGLVKRKVAISANNIFLNQILNIPKFREIKLLLLSNRLPLSFIKQIFPFFLLPNFLSLSFIAFTREILEEIFPHFRPYFLLHSLFFPAHFA